MPKTNFFAENWVMILVAIVIIIGFGLYTTGNLDVVTDNLQKLVDYVKSLF